MEGYGELIWIGFFDYVMELFELEEKHLCGVNEEILINFVLKSHGL
jgi:hypothetical protein